MDELEAYISTNTAAIRAEAVAQEHQMILDMLKDIIEDPDTLDGLHTLEVVEHIEHLIKTGHHRQPRT